MGKGRLWLAVSVCAAGALGFSAAQAEDDGGAAPKRDVLSEVVAEEAKGQQDAAKGEQTPQQKRLAEIQADPTLYLVTVAEKQYQLKDTALQTATASVKCPETAKMIESAPGGPGGRHGKVAAAVKAESKLEAVFTPDKAVKVNSAGSGGEESIMGGRGWDRARMVVRRFLRKVDAADKLQEAVLKLEDYRDAFDCAATMDGKDTKIVLTVKKNAKAGLKTRLSNALADTSSSDSLGDTGGGWRPRPGAEEEGGGGAPGDTGAVTAVTVWISPAGAVSCFSVDTDKGNSVIKVASKDIKDGDSTKWLVTGLDCEKRDENGKFASRKIVTADYTKEKGIMLPAKYQLLDADSKGKAVKKDNGDPNPLNLEFTQYKVELAEAEKAAAGGDAGAKAVGQGGQEEQKQ